MGRRLNDIEKRQLGLLIRFYRDNYFHSNTKNSTKYKQKSFCEGICSQAQLSRLEHGEPLRNHDIYHRLLDKLNIIYDRNLNMLYKIDRLFYDINTYQNDERLIINYNDFMNRVYNHQELVNNNIILLHYTYTLEFIMLTINEDYDEAESLIEFVEGTIDILPKKHQMVVMQYLGKYYEMTFNYEKSEKYYLAGIEILESNNYYNPRLYINIGELYIERKKMILSVINFRKALEYFIINYDSEHLEMIYRYLGLIYVHEKLFDEAIQYLYKSLTFAKRRELPSLIEKNLYYIAICYYMNDEYEEAIKCMQRISERHIRKKVLLSLITKENNLKELEYDTHKDKSAIIFNNFIYKINNDEEFENYCEEVIIPKFDQELLLGDEIIIRKIMTEYYKSHKKYKILVENDI